MKLEELTSPEISGLPKDMVVLVPVGSFEQHSIHLPVFTDSMIIGEIIKRLEARLPKVVLSLPVMWLGYSQHHMHYPGTVSASSSTHIDLMMDVVCSMVKHGFKKILILNGHGGNRANIAVLLQRLMERYEDAEIYACPMYFEAALKKLEEIQESGPTGSGHSGERETSMILKLRPDLVKTEKLDIDGQDARVKTTGVTNFKRVDKSTVHGGIGDARLATAEKGEKILEVIVESIARIVMMIREGVRL